MNLLVLKKSSFLKNFSLFRKKVFYWKKIMVPTNPCLFANFVLNNSKRSVSHSLINEAICLFNPLIASKLNLSTFKDKVLKAKGKCPKCFMHFSAKLRQHASICFIGITDFSKFLSKTGPTFTHKNQLLIHDTKLLRELPFFRSLKLLWLKRKLLWLNLNPATLN